MFFLITVDNIKHIIRADTRREAIDEVDKNWTSLGDSDYFKVEKIYCFADITPEEEKE